MNYLKPGRLPVILVCLCFLLSWTTLTNVLLDAAMPDVVTGKSSFGLIQVVLLCFSLLLAVVMYQYCKLHQRLSNFYQAQVEADEDICRHPSQPSTIFQSAEVRLYDAVMRKRGEARLYVSSDTQYSDEPDYNAQAQDAENERYLLDSMGNR